MKRNFVIEMTAFSWSFQINCTPINKMTISVDLCGSFQHILKLFLQSSAAEYHKRDSHSDFLYYKCIYINKREPKKESNSGFSVFWNDQWWHTEVAEASEQLNSFTKADVFNEISEPKGAAAQPHPETSSLRKAARLQPRIAGCVTFSSRWLSSVQWYSWSGTHSPPAVRVGISAGLTCLTDNMFIPSAGRGPGPQIEALAAVAPTRTPNDTVHTVRWHTNTHIKVRTARYTPRTHTSPAHPITHTFASSDSPVG